MRHVVALCGLLAVCLTVVRPAAACSCIPNPPPGEAFNNADIVFAGRVLDIQSINDQEYPVALDVTLWVERPFKGFFIETIRVRTARDSASCGFPFEQDERYLVYAHQDEGGTLRASLCSRTALLQDAREDLRVFDAIDLLGEDEGDKGGGRCGGPTNSAALQAMLFIFFVVALRRRGSGGLVSG